MIANLLKFALIRYLTWVIGEEGKEKNFHVYLLFYLLFSQSVVSNSLQPHGLQHTRPPCPSPTPRVYSNPCPLSRWCHPTISSSIIPFSSRLQSSPASGSFPISWLFASRDQSIGVSASVSVLSMDTWVDFLQDWLIWSLQSKGLSRFFSSTTIRKHQFFDTQPSLWSNPHIHTWPLEKQ